MAKGKTFKKTFRMKPFSTYQYVGGEMTQRDKDEIGSRYWNEGKWNSFIKPHLPKNSEEMTFIDIGCNAGLFLKLARKYGFRTVLGVESHNEARRKAIEQGYNVIEDNIESCVNRLPASDVILLSNTHYYINHEWWKKIIDHLKNKTSNIIIVTVKRRFRDKYAPSDLKGIRKDFKQWEEVSFIDYNNFPKVDEKHPRQMWSLCFKNPDVERVDIDSLDNGNSQQRDFYKQLDEGVDVVKTNYYRRLKSYRRHTGSRQKIWTKEELSEYMLNRLLLYESIKQNGLRNPLVVRKKDNRIIDGNHRHDILKHLGYSSVLIQYD